MTWLITTRTPTPASVITDDLDALLASLPDGPAFGITAMVQQ